MLMILVLASNLILAAGPALAQSGFTFDSQGGSGTFISPSDGGITFFHGSDGTMGTILPPPREGGVGFYNFRAPGGRPHSGTILTFPSPPPVATPPPVMAPVQPFFQAPPPVRSAPSRPSRWGDWQR